MKNDNNILGKQRQFLEKLKIIYFISALSLVFFFGLKTQHPTVLHIYLGFCDFGHPGELANLCNFHCITKI